MSVGGVAPVEEVSVGGGAPVEGVGVVALLSEKQGRVKNGPSKYSFRELLFLIKKNILELKCSP